MTSVSAKTVQQFNRNCSWSTKLPITYTFAMYFTTVCCSIVVVFVIQVLSYLFKCCVLIFLVCACPVYHCVICVYAIRSLDRNFPINTYLLTYLKIKNAAAHYCTSAFNWCIYPKMYTLHITISLTFPQCEYYLKSILNSTYTSPMMQCYFVRFNKTNLDFFLLKTIF